MKKLLAMILALVMVLGLCACGGSNGGSAQGETTPDGKAKLSIGMPTDALILDLDNNALTKWVEEECNVEIEFVEFAGGTDVATQISTTIAARQDLPDILLGIDLGESTVSRYGRDGYILDLSSYYEDKEGASKVFWDRINNELNEYDRDLVIRKITDPENGAIYGVPMVETSLVDKMQYQLFINVEWLDKLGLEKPTNNEELYEVLKAFKTGDPNGNGLADEIPLFGSQQSSLCGMVVDWLINLFCYYNPGRPMLLTDDGKLYPSYTTDEFREGLKFVNKLYKEELLTTLAWTASSPEMKQIITPSSGTALCGIFLGHLTLHANLESDILYQYEPLKNWGYAVRNDTSANLNTYITESCANPDKAFEVLMKLWTWDGSMRMRYGEYGVNWTEPTEGAKSDLGLDATYKLISDPFRMQNTARWPKMCTLNVYAEGETAEIATEMTEWMATKSRMHAESYNMFLEVEQSNNPKNLCPLLIYTEAEKEEFEAQRTNVGDKRTKAMTDFCTGILDVNDDAAWAAYIEELYDLGLQDIIDLAQKAYDRS